MKRLLTTFGLCLLASSAVAQQKTTSAIKTDILTLWPDNTTRLISPLRMRQIGNEIADSYANKGGDTFTGPLLLSGSYLNFNLTTGSGGYGIRDNAGTIEYKNSGGAWAAVGSGGGGGTPGGTSGQVQFNNAGSFGGFTVSGDGTLNTATGALAISRTGGFAFSPSATTDTTNATNITSGTLATARLPSPFTSGTRSGSTSTFVTATGTLTNGHCVSIDGLGNFIDAGGACTTGGGGGTVSAGTIGQLATYAASGTIVSGLATGTGVATALGVNTGSAGAFVVNGGALGTPSSATLTNATGLPTGSLTGTLQAAQEPAHTGDATNSAGSLVTTVGSIGGKAVTLGGAFTTSGGFSTTLTTTGTTALTLPTSGTVTALGNSVTGSGAFVLASSPTLTTPNLGTPTTLTLTNASGLPLAGLASQAANTVVGALTATVPSALAVPSCSTASSALIWTSGTGFGCNTISATGGKAANYQAFTASGTWTKPVGYGTTAIARIEGWGGGGSGGKINSDLGGGGGGGGYNQRWVLLSALGATETVTVGSGGAGQTTTSAGVGGGTSSFGTWLSAYGGGAGASGVGGGGGGPMSAASGGTPGNPLVSTGWDSANSVNMYQGGSNSVTNATYASWIHGGAGGVGLVAAATSEYGGGGGGGALSAAGTSLVGGAGGAGSSASSGTAGTAPAGGGGATTTGATSGAGARGEVRITVFDGT